MGKLPSRLRESRGEVWRVGNDLAGEYLVAVPELILPAEYRPEERIPIKSLRNAPKSILLENDPPALHDYF